MADPERWRGVGRGGREGDGINPNSSSILPKSHSHFQFCPNSLPGLIFSVII